MIMSEAPASIVRNALTVDVEDYFQASAFRNVVPRSAWDRQPRRVERNTRRVLELLAEMGVHSTFFVLGWVAERCPSLVREIQAAGHELGCHSYAHSLIYELTPKEFREDTSRALAAIEDAAGTAVIAYRAPSFSITNRSLWAFEILLELGFKVDSSVFPIRTPLYGIPGAPRQPFRFRTPSGEITEYPPAVTKIGPWNAPVTGGFYLRLLPGTLQTWALAAMARRAQPAVLYFHPWELDPEQPRLTARWGPKFYHYLGLRKAEVRLRALLLGFPFGMLSEISSCGLPVYEAGADGASQRPFKSAGRS